MVLVRVQLSVVGLYCPPLLKTPQQLYPPHTIISLPVHTADWCALASGAFAVLVAVQLSVMGLYLPPLFRIGSPAQIIISMPVQTAV
jgi:hypothetical protein